MKFKKTLKKKSYLTWKEKLWLKIGLATTITFFSLSLVAGLLTSVFGFALETYNIINTLKKELKNNIDSNHLIIDPKIINQNKIVKLLLGTALFHAYQITCISTLSEKNIFNEKLFNQYVNLADKQFKNDWVNPGYIKKNDRKYTFEKPINLYQFAEKILLFDKKVAYIYKKEFVNIGWYVTTKFSYLSQLLTLDYKKNDLYHEMVKMDKIVDQRTYSYGIKGKDGLYHHGMTAFMNTYLLRAVVSNKDKISFWPKNKFVNYSLFPQYYGLHVGNNKIWFTNWEVNNLKLIINLLGNEGKKVFNSSNADWYSYYKNRAIQNFKLSNLYKTNYKRAFYQLRIGTIFNLIVTPCLAVIMIGMISFNWNYVKQKKQKDAKFKWIVTSKS